MWHFTRTRFLTLMGVNAFAALLLRATPGSSQLQPSTLELRYEAPHECPSRDAVQQAALQLAGLIPSAPVVADVVIEKRSDGFLAHVKTRGGYRVLQDTSCAALAEAIEVLLALAIDPDARVDQSMQVAGPALAASESVGPELPSTRAALPNAAPTVRQRGRMREYPAMAAPQPDPRTGGPPSIFISALLGLELGAMPQVAEVGAAAVTFAPLENIRLVQSGRYWRRSTETLPGTTSGGEFSLWVLASAACLAATRATPSVNVCAGMEAGRLSGSGFGVRNNGSGGSLWLAPIGGFELDFRANRRVAILVAAEVGLPLVRRGFHLQGVGTEQSTRVHEPSVISGRLYLGLSLGF